MSVATRTPLPSRLAGALVFLASGAVLVLEVTGLRLVGPYIGVTIQSSSAVIAVALAAIAYGAWTGGWLADRWDPRRLLAPALLLSAATTAVVPALVRYAGVLLRGTDPTSILLLTVVTLFLPSALLSAVTPLVVKLQLADLDQTGRVVGRLSGIGTLGGITATLGTGFVLLATFGTSTIVLGLAGLLALAGAGLHVRYARPRSTRTLPRGGVLMAAVGLVGAGLTPVAPDPCDVETAYHCARVTVDPRRPGGRTLWLNSAEHSYVDLGDPRHLEFQYSQWIGALADVTAPPGVPVAALHLGGGGFTLPGYLAATRPGSDSVVLELDGRLVALDRARLGLRTGPRLRVVTGDARVNLAGQPSGAFDLVIGDAFGHLAVPWHLTTRELVADVRRTMRPGGVYAVNLIDRPAGRFARAETATLAAVFRHVALVAPPGAFTGDVSANWVVVGSDVPLPLDAYAARLAALPTPVELLSGGALDRFVGDARILTDDRAPVDQLLTVL